MFALYRPARPDDTADGPSRRWLLRTAGAVSDVDLHICAKQQQLRRLPHEP
jgi:hypothetical protein